MRMGIVQWRGLVCDVGSGLKPLKMAWFEGEYGNSFEGVLCWLLVMKEGGGSCLLCVCLMDLLGKEEDGGAVIKMQRGMRWLPSELGPLCVVSFILLSSGFWLFLRRTIEKGERE